MLYYTLSALAKLGITAYLLFGSYTIFVGFLEKDKKKIFKGALILIIPTLLLIGIFVLVLNQYGMGNPN